MTSACLPPAACRLPMHRGRGEALTDGDASGLTTTAARPPAEPTLAHLHGLERALAELAEPLRAWSGSRLVGA